MAFEAFVKDIRDNRWNVYGSEVYEAGRLTYEYGDTQKSRYPIYSATKTITSIGAGIAYDEGKIRVAFQNITVERLLTMSVEGFPFRPEGESYLNYSLSCPLENVQTRRFNYSNISAYLVGVALTNAVQEDLYQYLKRKLFDPLHIVDPVYTRCPDGYFYGASGMELTVHDLSRIGLLLYHGGAYEGMRIVSEEYVKRATAVQQMNREGGYGYFIWKYRDGFSINGKWKQKCYVLPERKLIVTYLTHIQEDSHALLDSMERHILGLK